MALATHRGTLLLLDENFAFGFLGGCTSTDPLSDGQTFVMHATGPHNGELWIADGGGPRRVLESVQNVPLLLFMIRRGNSMIHFAGSVEGASGLPAIPEVRPLAITPARHFDRPHVVFEQAVSGQIGFASDSRVFEIFVGNLPQWLSTIGAAAVEEQHPRRRVQSRADMVHPRRSRAHQSRLRITGFHTGASMALPRGRPMDTRHRFGDGRVARDGRFGARVDRNLRTSEVPRPPPGPGIR